MIADRTGPGTSSWGVCPTPGKTTPSQRGWRAAAWRTAATGTSRSSSPPMSRTGTPMLAIIAAYRRRRPRTRSRDRAAARNTRARAEASPGVAGWRRVASAISALISSGSARDGSAKHSSRTLWTASAGGTPESSFATDTSPRPGSAYSRNWAVTGQSGFCAGSGSAGSIRTTPAVAEGRAAAARMQIMPPMELPTRMAGAPTTSVMNRSTRRALACTVALRRVPGVRPKPCRSSATARRPAARCAPSLHQFRCEPPRPCTNTIGGWRSAEFAASRPASGVNSTQWTGPSRSVT